MNRRRLVLVVLDPPPDRPSAASPSEPPPDPALPAPNSFGRLGLAAWLPGAAPAAGRALGLTGGLVFSPGADGLDGAVRELLGAPPPAVRTRYGHGFPPDLVAIIEEVLGLELIGNRCATDHEILNLLGPLHLRTGRPLAYTSDGSDLRLAVHTGQAGADRLGEWCASLHRRLLDRPGLERVVGVPFSGPAGGFSLAGPPRILRLPFEGATVAEALHRKGIAVWAAAELAEILTGRGIGLVLEPVGASAGAGLETAAAALAELPAGLILSLAPRSTIVDERSGPEAETAAWLELDRALARLILALDSLDGLILAGIPPAGGSHGWLAAIGRGFPPKRSTGAERPAVDVARTIGAWFQVESPSMGRSFLLPTVEPN